jgi:hypothetical protein
MNTDEIREGLIGAGNPYQAPISVTELRKLLEIAEAAMNWDRAHPDPNGHCDDDDLRMCVTAQALKVALMEVQ